MIETYRRIRERHASLRQEAYGLTRDAAVAAGICGPALRLADIDERALQAWRETWTGRHPWGAGGWEWPRLVSQLPHRPAIMPLAIWYGDDLCGLALGHLSRRRTAGVRHTVTLKRVERRPEPPSVPLRRSVALLAINAAGNYGRALGARRMLLAYPDVRLLGFYETLGFRIARNGGLAVHCEQEL